MDKYYNIIISGITYVYGEKVIEFTANIHDNTVLA